jgi:hypothetical protein
VFILKTILSNFPWSNQLHISNVRTKIVLKVDKMLILRPWVSICEILILGESDISHASDTFVMSSVCLI